MKKSSKPRRAAAPAADARVKRAKPKAVTYTTEWIDPETGEIHAVSIKHTPKYFDHADHLEVEGARQGRGRSPTPHPLSQAGYLSIFIAPLELINAGGPVCYIDRLLADKLASKEFREASSKRAQGDLFAWAETRKAVTKRAARARSAPRLPKATPPSVEEPPDHREERLSSNADIYAIEWTDPVDGKTNTVFIRHTPKYFDHADRIEIAGEHEINVYRRTPHPLSDTGFLCMYVSPYILMDHRGPVGHVKRQLTKALAGVEFRELGPERVRGEPAHWAEVRKRNSKKAAKGKPSRPLAKPKAQPPKTRRPR